MIYLQEVKAWAERLIRDSQARSGYHTDIVMDEVPINPSLINLPKFVSYSETKDELPDGRHQISWFLLDAAGHNHLAILGIEKETRDGHYIYHTQNIFDKAAPLQAHNQEEVKRWLQWIIGPRTEPLTPFSTYRSRGRGKSSRAKARTNSISKSKSRGRGRPPRPLYPGSGLMTGTTSIGKRGRGNARIYDLDFDARAVTAAELRKWLEEEVKIREMKKSEALAYADDSLPVTEQNAIDRCFSILEVYCSKITKSENVDKILLVDTIGALRELLHIRPSLKLASDERRLSMLQTLMDHGHEVLKEQAKKIVTHWLKSHIAHLKVMFDESYVQDPRPNLESKCVLMCCIFPPTNMYLLIYLLVLQDKLSRRV